MQVILYSILGGYKDQTDITNRQIKLYDISFSDGAGNSLYLKSPATITATNTQTLQKQVAQ
jgi:hypothetical protein